MAFTRYYSKELDFVEKTKTYIFDKKKNVEETIFISTDTISKRF